MNTTVEIEIVLLLVCISLPISYLLHVFQKKRKITKHIGETFFMFAIVFSILLLPISILLIGGWDGLFVGAIGVYLLFPSISGLIFTKILKKYENKSM